MAAAGLIAMVASATAAIMVASVRRRPWSLKRIEVSSSSKLWTRALYRGSPGDATVARLTQPGIPVPGEASPRWCGRSTQADGRQDVIDGVGGRAVSEGGVG